MRTKFYLLLIALVTAVGSVWGQNTEGYAFNIAGVSGTSSLLRYSILTPAVGSEKGTVEVVGNSSYLTATDPFIIPATVTDNGHDYDVVAIGENAFYFGNAAQVYKVTAEIVIGPNVTELKYRSIRETGLTKIHIPANVKSISEEALFGNIYLSEVTIGPESDFVLVDNVLYSSGGKTLLLYPLADPLLATSYTVPAELESFGVINLPSTIERIRVESGNSFFSSRDGVLFSADGKTLIKYPAGKDDITIYDVPPSVETIAIRAFQRAQIEGINLSNVTHICYAAFASSSLTGTLIIPKTVISIDGAQFVNCISLVEVIFEGSVELINTISTEGPGVALFEGCVALKNVDFGTTTFEMLPTRIFNGCVSLEEVTIPEGVTSIGSTAFRDCESLTTLTILGETPPTVSSSAFSASATGTAPNLPSITLHVPKGSFDDYNTTSPWSGFGTILDDFYLVLYKNEGKTYLVETYPIISDYTLTEPTTPTREGYTFEGWYDVNGKVVPFDATEYGIHNTITARWAAIPLPVIPTYTITIEPLAGVSVNKPGGTVNEGRPFSFTVTADASGYRVIVYVNGKEHAPTSDNLYLIEGIDENKTVTFKLTAGNGTTGGDKIVIDEDTPSVIDGDYPPTGEIVVYPPVVTYPNIPSVTIDGEEVVPGGRWEEDEDGKPIFVIEYEGLEDGKHTIVIGDKTYTFTTSGGNRTSNDALSVAKVSASVGTVTIETPKAATVQIVSFSGSVVYNANVVGTVTVNVPEGIYAVVIDGTATKVVVR